MIDYQQEEQKQSRLVGGVATLLYAVLVALLLLLVKFTIEQSDESDGILINFGNVDEAAPGGDMDLNDELADARQNPQQSSRAPDDVEYVTQDFEEAPTVREAQQQQQNRPQDNQPRTNNNQQTNQPQAENRPQVDQRALFPGRTPGSTATSDGTGEGAGNQGDLAGDPSGSHDGTGTGTGGTGTASLAGRTLVGTLPRPDYNARDEGRVVVEITVDQSGRVTAAAYRSVGSTTQNSTLVASAIRAARQARFNVDEDAAVGQKGTITYNFRMQ